MVADPSDPHAAGGGRSGSDAAVLGRPGAGEASPGREPEGLSYGQVGTLAPLLSARIN